MTLAEYVRRHRAEIDAVIRAQAPHVELNDEDRVEWIRNDETLYRQAIAAGVRRL